jgi:hypothetical protein
MRTPPENANGALARGAAAKVEKTTFRDLPTTASTKRKQAHLVVLGSIPKSNSSQLRVAISEWRSERKIELRETTLLLGSTYFPAGVGVTLDIDRVPLLIDLLQKATQR